MGKKNKQSKYPVTLAIRALRDADAAFEPHLYKYVERGGTGASSRALGVDEHCVIKTLVMEDSTGAPLIVLMHGDREVSTAALARQLGVRKIVSCDPTRAQKHTGYQVGGTSPLGTRSALPVYAQQTISTLERLFINGGKRGFLVSMTPDTLASLLDVTWVEAATP